jgi:hypothetical protein
MPPAIGGEFGPYLAHVPSTAHRSIVLLGSLKIIAENIYEVLNNFEIVFQLDLLLLRRLIFIYGICLLPALNLYFLLLQYRP